VEIIIINVTAIIVITYFTTVPHSRMTTYVQTSLAVSDLTVQNLLYVINHWHWPSSVHSRRLCYSAEIMKHYHSPPLDSFLIYARALLEYVVANM